MYWISKAIPGWSRLSLKVTLALEVGEVELIPNGKAHPHGEMSRLAPNKRQGLAQAVVEGLETVGRYGIV